MDPQLGQVFAGREVEVPHDEIALGAGRCRRRRLSARRGRNEQHQRDEARPHVDIRSHAATTSFRSDAVSGLFSMITLICTVHFPFAATSVVSVGVLT